MEKWKTLGQCVGSWKPCYAVDTTCVHTVRRPASYRIGVCAHTDRSLWPSVHAMRIISGLNVDTLDFGVLYEYESGPGKKSVESAYRTCHPKPKATHTFGPAPWPTQNSKGVSRDHIQNPGFAVEWRNVCLHTTTADIFCAPASSRHHLRINITFYARFTNKAHPSNHPPSPLLSRAYLRDKGPLFRHLLLH
jgi:hypothetical protein